MFVVVTLDSARRPGALLRRCLRNCAVEQIPAGEKWFYHIRHYCPPARPDWKRLCRVLGREKARLLFPADMVPPSGLGIQRYDASSFYAGVLSRIFYRLLRSQPRPPGPVALIDRDAVLQNTAEMLLPLARQLIVCTNRSRDYVDFIRRAELSYGVSPVVSENGRPLQNAVAVLAPYGAGDASLPKRAVVLGRAEDGGYYLTDECFSLPTEVRDLIPAGIPVLEMLAALHEKCGLRLPAEEICPVLKKGGGESSVDGLIFTISCLT